MTLLITHYQGEYNENYKKAFSVLNHSIDNEHLIYQSLEDNDNRGFFIGSSKSTQRLTRLDEDDIHGQPRVALKPQQAGLNYVIPESITEDFKEGRLVRIGCEHGKFDSNDSLWKNIIILEISEVKDGKAYFTENIPFELKSGIFDGTVYPDFSLGYYKKGARMFSPKNELYEALDEGYNFTSPENDGFIANSIMLDGGEGYDDTAVARAYLYGKDLGQDFKVKTVDGAITDIYPSGNFIPGYNKDAEISIFHDKGTGARAQPIINGIRWKKLSNKLGKLPKNMNYSPVMQLLAEDNNKDINISNCILESEQEILSNIAVRAGKNITLDNIKLKGSTPIGIVANEGTTNLTIKNVTSNLKQHGDIKGETFSRGLSFYMSRATVDSCTFISGKGESARGIFAEGHSYITVKNSKFHCKNAGERDTVGILSEGSVFRVVDNEFHGHRYPLRRNQGADFGERGIAEFIDVRGNFFNGISAKAFRNAGVDPTKAFNEHNVYGITETYQSNKIQYPKYVEFFPSNLITFWIDIVVWRGNSFYAPFDRVKSTIGDINLKDFRVVVLSHSAVFKSKNNARVSVSTGLMTEDNLRLLFSDKEEKNTIHISNEQTLNKITDSDGSGIRYFDNREMLCYKADLVGVDVVDVKLQFQALIS